MINNVYCVAIDLINADKPPASLAFLAGACEITGKTYETLSLNVELLSNLDTENYNQIYSALKLQKLENQQAVLLPLLKRMVDKICDFNPDCVLISVFSYLQAPLAVAFFQQIRASNFQGHVVVGGPGVAHVNLSGKTNGRAWLEQDLIDSYCLGEGDEVLIQYLQGKRHVIGLNSNKALPENWVPQLTDLDQSAIIPSYKKVATSTYKNLENKSAPIFSISTSRGCVRRCTFCDVGVKWPKFRYRSGAHVAKEILKHHLDVGAVHFTIVDSLINGSLKSFRDFNLEMIKLKNQYPALADFSYNGMFIVRDAQSHPDSYFRIMKEAGCESLALGVETGSDRLRTQMDKKFSIADLDHHLEMCQKYKIGNVFMLFVGYPTETREDFEQTLRMLERYQKYLIDNTIIGINHTGVFAMLPDTPVFFQRDDLGIEIHSDMEDLHLSWSNNKNPDLTIKERIMRDLKLRETALALRYPIPYATRYLEYIKNIDQVSDLVPD